MNKAQLQDLELNLMVLSEELSAEDLDEFDDYGRGSRDGKQEIIQELLSILEEHT